MRKQSKESPSTVRLGVELDAQVDELCAEMDISKSAFIRTAVRHFVARQSHIDSVLQAARLSEAEFTATRRGVPWEEAEAWLNNWGGQGVRPPSARVLRD